MIILIKFYLNISVDFDKGHNAQHCLLVMIEKFRKIRDKKGVSAAVLTDLSKAFDCISHDLLIAKMNAYGVDKKSLSFVSAYLNNRQQKTKVGSSFSEYRNISFGVPQGSILGPLLFSIYICDLFLIIKEVDIASYADDTTPYVCKKNFDEAIHDLEKALDELFDWFSNNYFKANASKCHFLLSPFECRNITIKNTNVKSTKSEILLGVKIDSNLNFTEHVTTLCRKANQKLHALTRISKYMSFEKKRSVMKAFITSQFNYCPLIWMCHNRTLNNKINRIHEKALRITYDDTSSSFEELLNRDKSVTIHTKNIHYLATEIYKVKNELSPKIMKDVSLLSVILLTT